jgi:hypothetical protein
MQLYGEFPRASTLPQPSLHGLAFTVCAPLLLPSVQVLLSWDFEAKVFDPRDNIFNMISCGLYSCLTSAGLRKRNMRMLLTDRRVIMKEELYLKVPTIKVHRRQAE